jgi:hypothetical protein
MTMNTLFSLVGCSIVFADEDTGIIVTWNHSCTFTIFDAEEMADLSMFIDEREGWSVPNVPASIEEARRIAERHMREMQGNDEE